MVPFSFYFFFPYFSWEVTSCIFLPSCDHHAAGHHHGGAYLDAACHHHSGAHLDAEGHHDRSAHLDCPADYHPGCN